MQQLRIHVERVVRPIRAAVGRKNKMREELLAHLVQKTQALMAAGADDSTACAEAIEQLGDPAALRADLQATVPALERLAYLPFPDFGFFDAYFEKEDGESALHFAIVRTALIAATLGVLFALGVAVRWLGLLPGRSRPVTQPGYCLMMLSVSYVWTVLSTFVGYYLADVTGLRWFMSKATPRPAWIKAGSVCLFICADIVLMFVPIVLFTWVVNPADAAILAAVFSGAFGRNFALGILAGLLALFGVSTFAMKFEHEQWVKWGSLRIDD